MVSRATGSVAKNSEPYVQVKSLLALGPPWYTALSPSRTWSTTFWRIVGMATTVGMKVLQALVAGVAWLRATLFTSPWDRFFRARVTPAEPWSFSTGTLM